MKVFLTGATGYVGAAAARALVKAGHEVLGLTHNPEKKPALEAAGVTAVVGDVMKPDSYRKLADACDALVHAAFEYGPDAVAADKTALEALAASAKTAGAPRLLVYTSGVWVLGDQKSAPAAENAPLNPVALVQWRAGHEKLALAAAGGKVSVAVLRPGCLYGGKAGLYGMMIKAAVEDGKVHVVGDGGNRWAAVYVEDLGELYRLVAEKRPDKATYHAADGSAEPVREVAEAFLAAAGKPGKAIPLPLEEARKSMGPMADALILDQLVSGEKARKELGWTPTLDSVVKNAPRLVQEWKG